MVSMAAAADDDHDRHPLANPASPPSGPPAPAPSPRPPQQPHRRRLHSFSFPTLSWGTHRLLRCAKNPTSSPPPAAPDTPDKETTTRPPADGGAAGGGASSPQRAPQRPWNLRTRRSATAAPRDEPPDAAAADRAPPARHDAEAAGSKRGFSVVLSKEEIAEDFALFRGTRPPRRPKKRPRTVQRQINSMCPGFCLADLTPETYKIEER